MRRAVLGDGHGGMAGAVLEVHDLGHRHVGREGGVGHDEARLVILHGLDHGGLGLGGLVAVDEAHAALGGERDAHLLAGDGLHDGRDHGDVQADGGLLAALELDERGLEVHIRRDALRGRVAGHQQVLRERVGFTGKEHGHGYSSSGVGRDPGAGSAAPPPRRASSRMGPPDRATSLAIVAQAGRGSHDPAGLRKTCTERRRGDVPLPPRGVRGCGGRSMEGGGARPPRVAQEHAAAPLTSPYVTRRRASASFVRSAWHAGARRRHSSAQRGEHCARIPFIRPVWRSCNSSLPCGDLPGNIDSSISDFLTRMFGLQFVTSTWRIIATQKG